MFTDVLGLGMALAAIAAARGAGTSDRRTFGLYRAEVLAALANAVLLCGVAGWVVVEAVRRFSAPPEIPGLPLLLTAAAGLAANVVVFLLLRDGAREPEPARRLPRGARRHARLCRRPARRRGHAAHRVGLRRSAGRHRDRALRRAAGVRARPPSRADPRAGRSRARRRPAHAPPAGRPPRGARRPRRPRVDADLRHGGRVGAPVDRRGGRPRHRAVGGTPPAAPTVHGLPHFTVQVEPPGAHSTAPSSAGSARSPRAGSPPRAALVPLPHESGRSAAVEWTESIDVVTAPSRRSEPRSRTSTS